MIKFQIEETIVEIRENVINILCSYKQDTQLKKEKGGALMGKRLKNGNIIITDVTRPQPGDKESRFKNKKDKLQHQVIANQIWNNSNHYVCCIGEWHTHPERQPTPSRIDRKSWSMFVKSQNVTQTYYFIIVGIEEIEVWACNSTGVIKQLKKI